MCQCGSVTGFIMDGFRIPRSLALIPLDLPNLKIKKNLVPEDDSARKGVKRVKFHGSDIKFSDSNIMIQSIS